MVVLSQPAMDHFTPIKTYKSAAATVFTGIPTISLSRPDAGSLLVRACEEFGFFKVVSHGVPLELANRLEAESMRFFDQLQVEKNRAGPPNPFGYGSKRIGFNGDVGWIEYLLLSTNPDTAVPPRSLSFFQEHQPSLRAAVDNYVKEVRKLAIEVLKLIEQGLGLTTAAEEGRDVDGPMSGLLRDVKSDSCFRVNHYPPCQDHWEVAVSGRNLVGFGEHTDPQIISVLRSNNTSGLEICLRDGSWVTVPPDHSSFFINVGDTLQVLTNGKFKSVKHRVFPDRRKSRVSMIFFGGPPLDVKITPVPSLMEEGEESLYNEFTWSQYKKSAYKSRLADYRLGPFEKTTGQ
ncbi:hypothetical protein SAY87_003495 [Trapa incisa]|uniref:gibberellin 2beta-dioxygenase n=1 Tax=Trapa incisa TaxID=236973 RepID=A0AAN7KJ79_9MYRT|nr:hypothetical protein SAY87_003495 [Trapa incisa]